MVLLKVSYDFPIFHAHPMSKSTGVAKVAPSDKILVEVAYVAQPALVVDCSDEEFWSFELPGYPLVN